MDALMTRVGDVNYTGSGPRFTEGQAVAFILEEHARGFRTLTPEQRIALLESPALTLGHIQWANRLQSVMSS